LSPPMARAESAAVVQLSIPPDKPTTMPFAPAFSTYFLIKRFTLVSTSRQSRFKRDCVKRKLNALLIMMW